ncbi:hypothetical protein HRbin16_02859 [bacterium HR16]|nr:hypothetical protein HRbin16_02859 [bacterium HR16]
MQHQMPLAEGSACHVLPGQANGRSLSEDGRKGERFCMCPVDATVRCEHLTPPGKGALQFRVQVEIVGEMRDFGVQPLQYRKFYGGFDAPLRLETAQPAAFASRFQARQRSADVQIYLVSHFAS